MIKTDAYTLTRLSKVGPKLSCKYTYCIKMSKHIYAEVLGSFFETADVKAKNRMDAMVAAINARRCMETESKQWKLKRVKGGFSI